MRKLFYWWLGTVGILGVWYGLAANDLHFGMYIFSREMHDRVFEIYGAALGMRPEAIPPLVMQALVLDTFLVFGIIAFFKRKTLIPWMKTKFAGLKGEPAMPEAGPAPTAE